MKLQNIGIIGAMEEEIALLRQKASIIDTEQIIGVTFYKGTLYDKKWY